MENLSVTDDKEVELDEEIMDLIESRNRARKEKDWKKADKLRDMLLTKVIEIKDTPNGTVWSGNV